MPQVKVSAFADTDLSAILLHLAMQAGARVAETYAHRFFRLYDSIAERPEICAPRPRLGVHIRAGVVHPYLVIYRYVPGDDTVSIVRILHGRRNVTRRLLPSSL